MRRSSSLVLIGPLLVAGIVGGFVLYRSVVTRKSLPKAPPANQDSPGNPASFSDGPTYLDPGTSPDKKPLVDTPPSKNDEILNVQIDGDFAAVLQRIRSLETSKNGKEREAYLRALRDRLQADSSELERFIAFTGTLHDWKTQRIALILVGRVDSPRAVEYLLGIVTRGEGLDARRLAISALAQNGDTYDEEGRLPSADRVEVGWAPSLSDERGLPMVRLLDQSGLPEELTVHLLHVLRAYQVRAENSPDLRQRIREAVFRIASSSTEPPPVRSAAVDAIMDERTTEVQSLCRKLVETEPDQELRVYAADKLDLRDSDGLEFGLRMLAKEQDEEIRLRLVMRLPADDRTFEVFDRLVLGNASERMKLNCIYKLALLGDRGRSVLERLAAEDPSETVRDCAKGHLSKMKK